MISIGTATELTTDELGILLGAFAPRHVVRDVNFYLARANNVLGGSYDTIGKDHLDLPDPQEVGHGQPTPESV